jgi:hypothetical protein
MSVFPRPASPKAAWRDLKAFFKQPVAHKLGLAVLSATIPLVLVALFYLGEVPMEYRPPKIVYVEKFDPKRSDADIIAQQKIDAKKRAAEEAERQRILEANRKPFKDMEKKMDEWGL